MNIIVNQNTLTFAGKTYACAIGKGGYTRDKREGDGATPEGVFSLRECWYRPDKLAAPQTTLTVHAISPLDGWCDAPISPEYNRLVTLPYPHSHERMWREDGVYDVVVPLGYNDAPAIPGKGSAIFLHVAKPDFSDTEGCVALALPDLLEILAKIDLTSQIDTRQS